MKPKDIVESLNDVYFAKGWNLKSHRERGKKLESWLIRTNIARLEERMAELEDEKKQWEEMLNQ